jgi:hypothetical protein
MAAGMTNHVWITEEIIDLLDRRAKLGGGRGAIGMKPVQRPTPAFDRFPVAACRTPEGEERFLIFPLNVQPDPGTQVRRFSLSEAEARAQLTQAGLSEAEIDERIALARKWIAIITRPSGSEPVLGF